MIADSGAPPGYLRNSSGFSPDAHAGLVCDDPGMILRTRKQPGSPAAAPGSGTGPGAPGGDGDDSPGPRAPGGKHGPPAPGPPAAAPDPPAAAAGGRDWAQIAVYGGLAVALFLLAWLA